jgi:hypothetical protein
VRLTLETDDTQQIYMNWKGLRHGPKEVIDRLRAKEFAASVDNDPERTLGVAFASLFVLAENDRTLAFGTSADPANL